MDFEYIQQVIYDAMCKSFGTANPHQYVASPIPFLQKSCFFFHSNLITITEIVFGVYQFFKHGVFTTSRHGGFMDGEMGPLFPYATYGVCV